MPCHHDGHYYYEEKTSLFLGMARATGFEPVSYDFGDRCVSHYTKRDYNKAVLFALNTKCFCLLTAVTAFDH